MDEAARGHALTQMSMLAVQNFAVRMIVFFLLAATRASFSLRALTLKLVRGLGRTIMIMWKCLFRLLRLGVVAWSWSRSDTCGSKDQCHIRCSFSGGHRPRVASARGRLGANHDTFGSIWELAREFNLPGRNGCPAPGSHVRLPTTDIFWSPVHFSPEC